MARLTVHPCVFDGEARGLRRCWFAAVVSPLALVAALAPSVALAQRPTPATATAAERPCLSIARRLPAQGLADGVASLVDDLIVEPGCQVSLRSEGGAWVSVAGGPRSFLALVAEAQGLDPRAPRTFALRTLPHAVYARRDAAATVTRAVRVRRRRSTVSAALAGAPGQSFVLLSRCVDALGARPSLEAEVLPAARACEGPLEVRATVSAQCPAHIRVGDHTLEGSRTTTLASCVGGVSASYSVDAGSGRDGVRVIVGMVLAREAATPLQRWFFDAVAQSEGATRAETEPARLWTARAERGLWSLAPHAGLSTGVVAELRAAAEAGELVFSRQTRALGTVTFASIEGGGSFARVPDEALRGAMRAKYGPAGESISPTLREAREAMQSLRVCLPGRYRARPPRIERVGPQDACLSLARALDEDPRPASDDLPTRQIWLERAMWSVTARGAEAIERSRSEPLTLRASETPAALAWVASVGDRVGVQGAVNGLFVCGERGCDAMDAAGAHTLRDPGLYELRAAPTRELASTPHALTLARWVAVDPYAGWLPVGLVSRGDLQQGPLWAQLARDDDETFAFERRVHGFATRVALTERAVVVRSRARAEGAVETVLTGDVPLLANDARTIGAASRSALTVVLSRSQSCPDGRAMDLRAGELTRPEALAPATVFYAFLAEDRGPSLPLACLARARFRVRPRRVLAAAGPVVVGALGDPRIAWFSPWENWGAVGAILPALYLRASAGPWFSTELSLAAVSGFAPGRLALDVVGPALVLDARASALTVGVALFTPRLSSDRGPEVSAAPFIAVDVGSLYEMAGGR